MRLILLVEGRTEEISLPEFIRRWLISRNPDIDITIEAYQFGGWAGFNKRVSGIAKKYLGEPGNEEIIAVIGLLDLYGPTFYPDEIKTVEQRYEWAVERFEQQVEDERFRMFMAVHELEAWLLSQPDIFDPCVYDELKNEEREPEEINFDKPPKKLLDKIYIQTAGHKYNAPVYGYHLFREIDPAVAYEKCPYLRKMLNYILDATQRRINA